MSNSNYARVVPKQVDLETVTDWRMIVVGAGILLIFLVVPLGLATRSHPDREAPIAEAAPTPRAISPEPVSPPPPMAPIPVQTSFPPLEPYPVRKSKPLPAVVIASEKRPARVVASLRTPAQDVAPRAEVSPAPAKAPGSSGRTARNYLSDYTLATLLRIDVPEIKLDAEPRTSKQLLAPSEKSHPLLALLARRADLAGLPARGAKDCQASAESAKLATSLSRDVGRWRRHLLSASQPGADPSLILKVAQYIEMRLFTVKDWETPAAVPMLEQVLQSEAPAIRLLLVKQLAKIEGPESDAALARRAVFDVSEDVRHVAVEVMKTRSLRGARSTLLGALRYPWAPAADHAADAIVKLGDKDAVAELSKLVDLPDPSAPTYDPSKKAWFKPELTRVNHLSNCLLCHAASTTFHDPVRGVIPDPSKPLPEGYYQPSSGPAVRADVVYLRQDFSVEQCVAEPKEWPVFQRFDYFVRRVEVPAKEAIAMADAARGRDYPQRQAVLFAIHELSGARSDDSNRQRTTLPPSGPSASNP
jgi:hypothetical protein